MKRNLVLVGVAFLMGLAWVGTAAAQVTLTVSGVPRTLRAEGLTEVTGQVVLTATSTGTIVSGSKIFYTYNTSITNAVTLSEGTGQDEVTCAGPTPPACGVNLSTSASGSVFTVTFVANQTFTAGDTITLSDVRVSGAALGKGSPVAVTVTALIPPVSEGTNPISFFGGNTTTVGNVFNGNSTTVTVTPATSPTILICIGADTFPAVTVVENFAGAVTSLSDETTLADDPSPTSGTDISITFSNVPIGVTITPGAPLAPAGFTSPTFASTPAAQTSASGAQNLTFVYVATATDTTSIQATTFPFDASLAGTFAGGTGSVSASVSLTSTATGSGVIRFASNTQPSTGNPAFSVAPCETDLLFPFVANTVGFDTGIAIANTTTDPFPVGGALPTNGTCTFSVFPSSGGTSVGSPVSFPITVNSGGTGAVVLSTTAAAGMQGYAIARCNFLNAHAFAFLDNPGATGGPNLAEGYVALVIPNPAVVSRAVPGGGAGEGLKQ
jgi:hypothetical protein